MARPPTVGKSNLRILMDEVFGADNFVAQAEWQKRYTVSNNTDDFTSVIDHVLVYRRSEAFKIRLLPRTEEADARYENPDDDPRGPWKPIPFLNPAPPEKRRNLCYEIRNPNTGEVTFPTKKAWRSEESVFKKHLADNRLWWGADGRSAVPDVKRFLSEVRQGMTPTNFWPWEEAGNTDEAVEEIKRIFGEKVFDTPKPTALVRRILQHATDPESDDIILDSFAGSGTTGHATLLENDRDGGGRRFILVQQRFDTKADEQQKRNLAKQLTAERVRRTISGYEFDGREQKVLFEERITLSRLKRIDDLRKLAGAAAESGARKFEDVITELKDGVIRVIGYKTIRGRTAGLGGAFSYVKVGDPLFGEYRDFGEKLPKFEEIAKYIFYTETSREIDLKKVDEKTGFIGSTEAAGGTSYYLFYTPNKKEDRELSTETLKALLKKDRNRTWVIYCEKIWLHGDQLRKFEKDHGKRVRPMLVPFNLK